MPAIAFLVAVGIDIAKASFDAARLGADGKYKHKRFANTPEGFALFAEWLAGFGPEPAHLCMEATGAYSLPLAGFLAARGFHVSVVNPAIKQRAELLESIPGVGAATAAWLLTLLSEHRGFTSAKQAAAFAGLAPRLRQSGKLAGQTCLSKMGDPMLRKALYMPMLSALCFNPAIRAFYQRLKAAGKPGKSCVCAAMRKIIHIAFAILKSGRPFDPEYKPA